MNEKGMNSGTQNGHTNTHTHKAGSKLMYWPAALLFNDINDDVNSIKVIRLSELVHTEVYSSLVIIKM